MPPSLIEGQPVLLVIDIQKDSFLQAPHGIPKMPGYAERMQQAVSLIQAARSQRIPIIFFQEAHRPSLVDFGRELDGQEGIHCLEGDSHTEIATEVGMQSEDYFIRKRRYSCFFGTDLEILLKGLKAQTLLLIGGLTDVCVHYTFVDGHQHDYYCRVIEDCVAGSSEAAHKAALNAMEYLQTGARQRSESAIAAMTELTASAL